MSESASNRGHFEVERMPYLQGWTTLLRWSLLKRWSSRASPSRLQIEAMILLCKGVTFVVNVFGPMPKEHSAAPFPPNISFVTHVWTINMIPGLARAHGYCTYNILRPKTCIRHVIFGKSLSDERVLHWRWHRGFGILNLPTKTTSLKLGMRRGRGPNILRFPISTSLQLCSHGFQHALRPNYAMLLLSKWKSRLLLPGLHGILGR